MKRIIQTVQTLRRWAFGAAVVLVSVITSVLLPAPSVGATGCHYFDYHATLSAGSYVYTDIYTVPSSSSCNDINIYTQIFYDGTEACSDVRVRFYPSSGGNYANSWKWHCNFEYLVVASNVANGTRYRLEFNIPSTAMLGVAFD